MERKEESGSEMVGKSELGVERVEVVCLVGTVESEVATIFSVVFQLRRYK